MVAYATGEVETTEISEWPDIDDIQTSVGGTFAIVPSDLKLTFEHGVRRKPAVQQTVIYCNEEGLALQLPPNRSLIAASLNRERTGSMPLVGDLLIVSGTPSFMSRRSRRG
jgi:hypothetical protein